MRIAVYGLGYVGCVSAAALTRLGHDVVGVDTNEDKVAAIAAGESPVLEPGLPELVAEAVAQGRLTARTDGEAPITEADIALICVGTPSRANGSTATEAIERVSESIGRGLGRRDSSRPRATVVLRSTSLPGTTEELVGPIVERESGKSLGSGFGLAMNPEFLREGSSLEDFFAPPKTVIGELDGASGDGLEQMYAGIPGPVFRVPIRVAEMVKYADNAFHATKIAFANEIGTLSRELGLDSHEVMNVFCADTKLNISAAYLKPGFAFGGSCLPKDLRALVHAGRRLDVSLPLLENVIPSNETHLQRVLDVLIASGRKRIGLFGLSFKPGTDDLRESPLVELAERLLGKGFDVRIYDPTVSLSRLVGANRAYVEEHIPHLSRLLSPSASEVFAHADVVVVGATTSELLEELPGLGDRLLVDLVRLPEAKALRGREGYVGVAW
ncbi:MAG TPA: nucleotide sugar dehydrogenase [Gaiella sp.]|nr:nucleotide sugar dehydrogenase [Gaiella sp.]